MRSYRQLTKQVAEGAKSQAGHYHTAERTVVMGHAAAQCDTCILRLTERSADKEAKGGIGALCREVWAAAPSSPSLRQLR